MIDGTKVALSWILVLALLGAGVVGHVSYKQATEVQMYETCIKAGHGPAECKGEKK